VEFVNTTYLAILCTHKTSTHIVVAIAGIVVVAISRPQILGVVVPAAAT
jgi:hypothetical protein